MMDTHGSSSGSPPENMRVQNRMFSSCGVHPHSHHCFDYCTKSAEDGTTCNVLRYCGSEDACGAIIAGMHAYDVEGADSCVISVQSCFVVASRQHTELR